eukprot:COSAG06_NODE_6392_length_2952_cov_2.691903_4_plen_88_part_00
MEHRARARCCRVDRQTGPCWWGGSWPLPRDQRLHGPAIWPLRSKMYCMLQTQGRTAAMINTRLATKLHPPHVCLQNIPEIFFFIACA